MIQAGIIRLILAFFSFAFYILDILIRGGFSISPEHAGPDMCMIALTLIFSVLVDNVNKIAVGPIGAIDERLALQLDLLVYIALFLGFAILWIFCLRLISPRWMNIPLLNNNTARRHKLAHLIGVLTVIVAILVFI